MAEPYQPCMPYLLSHLLLILLTPPIVVLVQPAASFVAWPSLARHPQHSHVLRKKQGAGDVNSNAEKDGTNRSRGRFWPQ